MLDNQIEYLRALPWKDWVGPLITSFLALFGVIYVQRERSKIAHLERTANEAKVKRDEEGRQHVANQSMVVAQTQDLTERLNMLMDGYEVRIKDLTEEVTTIKQNLKTHESICRRCPNYPDLARSNG